MLLVEENLSMISIKNNIYICFNGKHANINCVQIQVTENEFLWGERERWKWKSMMTR